jgi:hypothetical protein
MSINKLRAKINETQKLKIINQDIVGTIMRLTRGALEERGKNASTGNFWHLNFFCTWCAHYELSKNYFNFLENFSEALFPEQAEAMQKAYNDRIADIFNLKKLREQLIIFFRENNIEDYLFAIVDNWKNFSSYLLSILIETKITFPDDISKIHDSELIKIYERMKNKPDGLACKSFWVTQGSFPDGYSGFCWNVITFSEKNILIRGKLFMNENFL